MRLWGRRSWCFGWCVCAMCIAETTAQGWEERSGQMQNSSYFRALYFVERASHCRCRRPPSISIVKDGSARLRWKCEQCESVLLCCCRVLLLVGAYAAAAPCVLFFLHCRYAFSRRGMLALADTIYSLISCDYVLRINCGNAFNMVYAILSGICMRVMRPVYCELYMCVVSGRGACRRCKQQRFFCRYGSPHDCLMRANALK